MLSAVDRGCSSRLTTSTHLALALQSSERLFARNIVVFAFEQALAFCVLQSRPHEVWARFFASSMKDDLRYTPSDCFETFPFPRELRDRSPRSKPPARPITTTAPR